MEREVGLERGALPRDLASLRVLAHRRPYRLEGLLHGRAGLAHLLEQVACVEAVAPGSVGGDRSRGGRERDQRARRRLDLRQALRGDLEALAEGVVAARVEDHQVHGISGGVELLHHRGEVHGRELHLVLALDVGIDRDEVVAPAHLHAMAREIEHAGGIARELVAELAQRQVHLLERRVLALDDGEARGFELLRDVGAVVHGVGQRRVGVLAVADHERHARRFRLLGRREARAGGGEEHSERG